MSNSRPFRFYDNRQKYLAFVNTCNEKWKVAERAAQEIVHIKPTPPAFRLFDAPSLPDYSLLRRWHRMHKLPNEISESIGMSTLFAAWNAAIYVAQIEDERLKPVVSSVQYFEVTADCLHKHNGLWFNDETFVISRRHNNQTIKVNESADERAATERQQNTGNLQARHW